MLKKNRATEFSVRTNRVYNQFEIDKLRVETVVPDTR